MEEFISTWQSLIGSALGPFFAVLFSAIGFWLKSSIENNRNRKESLRRIEISLTRSLDDTYKIRIKLQDFVSRVRSLAADIRQMDGPRNFSLETTNFPTLREGYRDADIPILKTKSYYLHNKLLWVDAGIKETNETIASLKSDYIELLRKNELHIILMRQNQNPDAALQRNGYAENLEIFATAVGDFANRYIDQGIKIMLQAKIYNSHLRRRYHGRYYLWKHESVKFKYFSNKAQQKAFVGNFDSMDRIDELLESEVESLNTETEIRSGGINMQDE